MLANRLEGDQIVDVDTRDGSWDGWQNKVEAKIDGHGYIPLDEKQR